MSNRERFNEWYTKEYEGHDSGLLMTVGAAWQAWQAAERQALERALRAAKDAAQTHGNAVDHIAALIEQSASKEKQHG